jgi:hypothetical protein
VLYTILRTHQNLLEPTTIGNTTNTDLFYKAKNIVAGSYPLSLTEYCYKCNWAVYQLQLGLLQVALPFIPIAPLPQIPYNEALSPEDSISSLKKFVDNSYSQDCNTITTVPLVGKGFST